MAILFKPFRSTRRLRSNSFILPVTRRLNEHLYIPLRLSMWFVHLTSLICVSYAIHELLDRTADGLNVNGSTSAYIHLARRASVLCVATAFCCLAMNLWGVVTGRTLRFGGLNLFHSICDAAGAVTSIILWSGGMSIDRFWIVFYTCSMLPTLVEVATLLRSYRRGIDM